MCMWGLPGPGVEPVSPALAGRFFTTEPPWKLSYYYFFNDFIYLFLALLGLCCSVGFSLVVVKGGYSFLWASLW